MITRLAIVSGLLIGLLLGTFGGGGSILTVLRRVVASLEGAPHDPAPVAT